MQDIRGFEVTEVKTSTKKTKMLGAGIVALGVVSLGVISYASGALSPAPVQTKQQQELTYNEVPTTPRTAMPPMQQQTPAPAAMPNALDETPLAPQMTTPRAKSGDADRQAAVTKTKKPSAKPPVSAEDTGQQAAVSQSPMTSTPVPSAPVGTPAPAAAPPENAVPSTMEQSEPATPSEQPSQPETVQPPQ